MAETPDGRASNLLRQSPDELSKAHFLEGGDTERLAVFPTMHIGHSPSLLLAGAAGHSQTEWQRPSPTPTPFGPFGLRYAGIALFHHLISLGYFLHIH